MASRIGTDAGWRRGLLAAASLTLVAAPATAGAEGRAAGKLLLTNGIGTVDGTSGGGLATWATIAGNETVDGIGGAVHVTRVPLADFSLTSVGAAVGIRDRVELSYARQSFDTRAAGAALGLGHGFRFGQDVFAAKVRLAGEAVYDQDRWLPQISVGAEYRRADRGAIIHAVGGAHAAGADFTLSATKLFLAQSLVVSATVRATRANQFGLLGYGGDRRRGYSAEGEGSIGYLLTRRLVVGAEGRTKPDDLAFARETAAYDLFAAYALTRNVSLAAAYVDLGPIATFGGQRGAFLSLQASF